MEKSLAYKEAMVAVSKTLDQAMQGIERNAYMRTMQHQMEYQSEFNLYQKHPAAYSQKILGLGMESSFMERLFNSNPEQLQRIEAMYQKQLNHINSPFRQERNLGKERAQDEIRQEIIENRLEKISQFKLDQIQQLEEQLQHKEDNAILYPQENQQQYEMR
jgi:hypothetical protein